MKKGITAVAVMLLIGAGAYMWQYNQADTYGGPSAPRSEAAQVNYDWVLADGELLAGTSEINVPLGINVHMHIDNDQAGTLLIKGYDAEFELAPERIVNVEFYTHKTGRYQISLDSSQQVLATLTVVDS